MRNTIKHLCLIGIIGFFASIQTMKVAAFEARLETQANDEVRDAVSNASLTIALERKEAADSQEILAAARADYGAVLAALYARGYYSGVIRISVDGREASNISLLAVPRKISRVVISVDPGHKFVFGRIAIAPLATATELPRGFRKGATARSRELSKATKAATDAWRDQGHAKARVSGQRIIADHPGAVLHANFQITPGPKVRFGAFILNGNQAVRASRIREIAGFPSGEMFSPAKLNTVSKRLHRSGVFRSVTLSEAETLQDSETLNVTAQLVEAKPRRFGFGAEISSLEGGRISGFWLHRNLFGGAERLGIEGDVSGLFGTTGVDYSLSGRFDRPATIGPDISLFAIGEIAELDEPDFFSRQAQVSLGLSAILSDDLVAEVSAGYRFSEVIDDFGDRSFNHIVAPLTATYDRRNSELNPTSGFYLQAGAMPYLGVAGSASGMQVTGDLRAYHGFGGSDNIVLAGRLQAGSILKSELAETPPDLLFFSGGGGSVRGQPYQSLNVDLGAGNSSGGRAMLGFSTELRVAVSKNVGIVGFLDVGFVGADSFSTGSGNWHSGAGIGLRYKTGIGPIRLDVAAPVGGDTGAGVQIYVGIGQAF